MADRQAWLVYHLPKTRIRLKSSVTERFDLRREERTRQVKSEIALETGADPAAFYRIDLKGSKLSDESFGLELTQDGRLVSTESKAVGRLGKVVKNVFSFVSSVVAIAGRIALGAAVAPAAVDAGAAKAEEDPVLRRYREAHPQWAQRRQRAGQVLELMRSKMVDIEEEIVAEKDPAKRKERQEHLKDLASSSEALFEELKRLDTHFQAWKAGEENETSEELVFTFDLDDLPKVSTVESWKGLPTSQQLGRFASAFERLDLVLARDEPAPLPSSGVPQPPGAGDSAPGMFFRCSRPLGLVLYLVRDERLVGVKSTTELVMDGHCRLGYVEIGKTRWSEFSVETAFWPDGGLKSLKSFRASEAAAATDALRDLPVELKASLEQANEIIDQQQKLDLQGIEQRIAELEKQKSLVEKEIALGGVLDTRRTTEEIARLKAEIDLLRARKDLGVAERELLAVSSGSAIQLETELLKLRTDLERAQVARLKVESELRELQKPAQ